MPAGDDDRRPLRHPSSKPSDPERPKSPLGPQAPPPPHALDTSAAPGRVTGAAHRPSSRRARPTAVARRTPAAPSSRACCTEASLLAAVASRLSPGMTTLRPRARRGRKAPAARRASGQNGDGIHGYRSERSARLGLYATTLPVFHAAFLTASSTAAFPQSCGNTTGARIGGEGAVGQHLVFFALSSRTCPPRERPCDARLPSSTAGRAYRDRG